MSHALLACSVPGCARKHHARGLCKQDYEKAKHRGELVAAPRHRGALLGRRCCGALCTRKPKRWVGDLPACAGHLFRYLRGNPDWRGELRPSRPATRGQGSRERLGNCWVTPRTMALLEGLAEARGLRLPGIVGAEIIERVVEAMRLKLPHHRREALEDALSWMDRVPEKRTAA